MTQSNIILRAQLLSVLNESGQTIVTVAWKNQVMQFLTEDLCGAVNLQNNNEVEITIPQNRILLQECTKGKSTALNRVSCQLLHAKRYENFTSFEVVAEQTTFSIMCPTEFCEELNWGNQESLEMVFPHSGIHIYCSNLTNMDTTRKVATLQAQAH